MLLQDVLNMIPYHWEPRNYNDQPYSIISITNSYSPEYIDVKTKFEGAYYSEMTGIFKIQNPTLWAKFLLKKYEFEQRGQTIIKSLYHDTAESNVRSICHWNLDWKYGSRFMFGPGVYFSLYPDIAFKHSSRNNGIYRAMFIFDVLVQNIFQQENVFLPNPGFDTVLAHGGCTFVKYFDCEYYPRFKEIFAHLLITDCMVS